MLSNLFRIGFMQMYVVKPCRCLPQCYWLHPSRVLLVDPTCFPPTTHLTFLSSHLLAKTLALQNGVGFGCTCGVHCGLLTWDCAMQWYHSRCSTLATLCLPKLGTQLWHRQGTTLQVCHVDSPSLFHVTSLTPWNGSVVRNCMKLVSSFPDIPNCKQQWRLLPCPSHLSD